MARLHRLTGRGPSSIVTNVPDAPSVEQGALFGAVAQLGERLNGIQEVRGSTPLGSTKLKPAPGAGYRETARKNLAVSL